MEIISKFNSHIPGPTYYITIIYRRIIWELFEGNEKQQLTKNFFTTQKHQKLQFPSFKNIQFSEDFIHIRR